MSSSPARAATGRAGPGGRLAGWLARRRLRTRLLASMLALLALACAVVGLATTYALRGFLLGRLDQQLRAAGSRYSVSLEYGDTGRSPDDTGSSPYGGPRGLDVPPGGFGDVRGQAVGTLGARVINGQLAQAAIVTDDGRAVTFTLDDVLRLGALTPDGKPRNVQLDAVGGYRVLALAGRDGDVLVAGLPLTGVGDAVARLAAVEIVVFAVTLLATGLAGAVLVRLSLRPLARVTSTAQRVAALPLASGEVALPPRSLPRDPGTEVGQLGAAFDHMLDHVESALTERQASESRLRQFIADASHELRTPLAAIRSHTELALRLPERLPAPVEHALHRVEAASARMATLVEDLLLLARLDAGRPLANEPVDLTRLAIEATSDARAGGRDHRWALELPDEPVIVAGDEQRLHQVLANLLANARTHTPPHTLVTVAVAVPAGSDYPHTAALTVSDTGPGVPPELLPRIFERFTRGDSARSRAAGSTGLGLAIVAAVVKAHAGSVTASRVEDRTVFRVLLPLAGEPVAAAGIATSPELLVT